MQSTCKGLQRLLECFSETSDHGSGIMRLNVSERRSAPSPICAFTSFRSHSPRACTILLSRVLRDAARQCCQPALHDSAANAWQCRRCMHGHSKARTRSPFTVQRSAFTLDSVLHLNHLTSHPHDPGSP